MIRAARLLVMGAVALVSGEASGLAPGDAPPPRYLAFQIFTPSHGSPTLARNFPPLVDSLADQVEGLIRAIGTVGADGRRLGFIIGPLAFDDSDEQVRGLMSAAFAVALEKDIAVGFHVDDSMFWDRLSTLDRPENVEWLGWDKTPCTGRRLDWSSVPTRIMPQLCLNSPAVVAEVRRRAALIGREAALGMKMLQAHGKADLFIGVIAGWETQIGKDFETGKPLGYHALANLGYSAENPPANADLARVAIVNRFVELWATSLAEAGVPDENIYSHTAFMSRASFDMKAFGQRGQAPADYLETIDFTPPGASFGTHHRAGFSTYPQFGLLEQLQAELATNGNPPWASSEGTSVDPADVAKGGQDNPMETYLGNLFGRGAVVVNLFGWGVGPPSNPFRKIAESPKSIAAYQEWLRGAELPSDPPAQVPSPHFFEKLRKLQQELPSYIAKHGPEGVGVQYGELSRSLNTKRFGDAEGAIDQIFADMRQ